MQNSFKGEKLQVNGTILAKEIDITLVFSPLGYGVIRATTSSVIQGESYLYHKIIEIRVMEWKK